MSQSFWFFFLGVYCVFRFAIRARSEDGIGIRRRMLWSIKMYQMFVSDHKTGYVFACNWFLVVLRPRMVVDVPSNKTLLVFWILNDKFCSVHWETLSLVSLRLSLYFFCELSSFQVLIFFIIKFQDCNRFFSVYLCIIYETFLHNIILKLSIFHTSEMHLNNFMRFYILFLVKYASVPHDEWENLWFSASISNRRRFSAVRKIVLLSVRLRKFSGNAFGNVCELKTYEKGHVKSSQVLLAVFNEIQWEAWTLKLANCGFGYWYRACYLVGFFFTIFHRWKIFVKT